MDRLDVPNEHSRRLGKISFEEVHSFVSLIPEVFKQLNFIPIHIDLHSYCARITYTGYSPKFEKLIDGEVIPEYEVEMLQIHQTEKMYVGRVARRRM